MEYDADLFLSIAEIAGIFVGFGALISFSSNRGDEARAALRDIVMTGLIALVGALFPVGLGRYGLVDQALWGWSSAGLLLVIWVGLVLTLRDAESRERIKAHAKANPALAILFWVFLEVPLQVPLVLVVLGVAPSLASAFYVTALLLTLFEAAFMLVRLVLKGESDAAS